MAHKFEEAGLGQAPYDFIQVVDKVYQACQGAPIQPGSSCDYCGTGIRYEYWLRSADAREFKVGCDCVLKVGSDTEKATARAWQRNHQRELAHARRKATYAARAERDRAELLSATPGLAEALETDHRIVKDISARLRQWGNLSPRQIELVFKLAREASEPKIEKPKADAPEGRQAITGTVISVKEKDTQFGWTWKMVVEVETEAGFWRCYGTVPRSILDDSTEELVDGFMRGATVEFTAEFRRSDDPDFAFFSRPTQASRIAV